MLQVLAGVRHIMETSLAQDSKLLEIVSILATQAEQIKVRDQSIMIMQSKIEWVISSLCIPLSILSQYTARSRLS